ncbi:MAG: hypothetical protein ISQ54_07810 [Candidatus Poseidonia sp.]|nr:hypothetical protein [Poseidonia sp.]
MGFVYGAIAQGTFDNVGHVSSLGKAGVSRNGQLKKKACSSPASAKLRALKSVANRLRFRNNPDGEWIIFKDLHPSIKEALLVEVRARVRWESIGFIEVTSSLHYSDFKSAYAKVAVA